MPRGLFVNLLALLAGYCFWGTTGLGVVAILLIIIQLIG